MNAIKLNSDLAYVNILCDYIITKPFNYDTTDESTIKCLTKPNTNYTFSKLDVDVFVFIFSTSWDRYTSLN